MSTCGKVLVFASPAIWTLCCSASGMLLANGNFQRPYGPSEPVCALEGGAVLCSTRSHGTDIDECQSAPRSDPRCRGCTREPASGRLLLHGFPSARGAWHRESAPEKYPATSDVWSKIKGIRWLWGGGGQGGLSEEVTIELRPECQ